MSEPLRIPHGARIVVADAKKALLLSNIGDEAYPNLRVIKVLHATENPPTSQQGTDRPGRTGFAGRKSSVGQTDWHRQAEDHFAGEVADALLAGDETEPLILVAPPSFLAELRKRMPERVKPLVRAEIPKDLTHLPVGEIERNLAGT